MEAFAPDFSYYWLGQPADDSNVQTNANHGDDEPMPPSLKEALDALAERINAARSIV